MEFKSGPIRLSAPPKARDPAADRLQVQAVESKLAAGDIEGAVALAEASLRNGLEHPLIFNLAADRLESEGRYVEALALLERGHRLSPTDLGLRQALGLCLFRLQRFEASLPHFEALIAAQPGFAHAHAARGAALEQLGRAEEAQGAFQRAFELEPQNLLALSGLATLASGRGDHVLARSFADKVLAAEPGYPDAMLILARADLAEGHYEAGDQRLLALIADARTPKAQRALAQELLDEMRSAKDRKFDA